MTVTQEAEKDRPIYRNSEDFGYLAEGNQLIPGGKYFVDNSACSFGWMVTLEKDKSRLFNLTAGHCGEVGDTVYLLDDAGNRVAIGEFVWREFDERGNGGVGPGMDHGLIEIYSDYHDLARGTPTVSYGDSPAVMRGSANANWLTSNEPYICRIGWRSGLSCGNFKEMRSTYSIAYDNISDRGDSGGAVWAMNPDDPSGAEFYAVGVSSYMANEDAATGGAKVIAPVLEELGLTPVR